MQITDVRVNLNTQDNFNPSQANSANIGASFFSYAGIRDFTTGAYPSQLLGRVCNLSILTAAVRKILEWAIAITAAVCNAFKKLKDCFCLDLAEEERIQLIQDTKIETIQLREQIEKDKSNFAFLKQTIEQDSELVKTFKECLEKDPELEKRLPIMDRRVSVRNAIVEEWGNAHLEADYWRNLKMRFKDLLEDHPSFAKALLASLNKQNQATQNVIEWFPEDPNILEGQFGGENIS